VTVAVYTAILGGYNELQTHPEIPGVDWIAFVDAPLDRDDWDIRVVRRSAITPPRRAAKLYKMLPHVVLPVYEETIWIDGTVKVISPRFVEEAMPCAEETGFALFRHPERDCIYTEAVVSLSMEKYRNEPLLDQVTHYADNGYPVDGGLWACGILARRDTNAVRTLMEDWLDEVEAWSVQDQLALPYCLWTLGFEPGRFPGHLYANPWLTVTGHDPAH
jgi:Protein of unknown function (DUF616)